MPDAPSRPESGRADPAAGRPANVSKVARLIDAYGLESAGQTLEARWLGEDGERQSLRALADRFNRWLLRAAMDDAGVRYLDGEVENRYRLLTSDDVSRGARTRARRTLAREGVAVDALEADFVSHQAMHTYLTKHRGVEAPADGDDDATRLARGAETVQRLRNRLTAVTERTLDDLEAAGLLAVGDVEVLVDVTVVCPDCGRSADVRELIDAGGCDCARDAAGP